MQELLQYLFSGITNGAVYAVIALGFSMLYSSTGLINFAHGEFVMVGALSLISLWKGLKLPLPAAMAGAVAVTAVAGLLLERLALRTVRKPNPIVLVIITVGASILVRGIAMLGWGKDPHSAPPYSGHAPIDIAGATLLPQSLWVLILTLIVVLGLHFFHKHLLTGRAMLATAINRKAAEVVGIPTDTMVLLAFAMSAAMGGIAGALIAPLSMSSFDMGMNLGLKGFCAAMIGGLGSSWGAVFGGVLLGIIEALGVGFLSSGLKDASAFVLLLMILYFRPTGLLGKATIQRF
ncbi:MAG: branched-chain amino acid ABC transporter permease [Syntrophobacteraceae bacterium]